MPASLQQTNGELSGQHAAVTGGGRGIGLAIAAALTRAGAAVTVMGRTEETLAAAVGAGKAAGYVVVDVTAEGQLAAALASAESARGGLSILINNAGGITSTPFLKTSRAMWLEALHVNLTSAFEGCQAVLPGMTERRYGRIVNIASTAGLKGYRFVAAYCAAKHGLIGLTRGLAHEYARSGVTINAVCPGYTETELVANSARLAAEKTGKSADEIKKEYARANPMGRLIAPEEVADAVRFLCAPAATAMTGQSMVVAAGEVM